MHIVSTLNIQYVFLSGHQCKVREDYPCNFKTSVTSGQKEFWILISGIILVGIYGLTVSIIAAVIWVRYSSTYKPTPDEEEVKLHLYLFGFRSPPFSIFLN